MLIRSNTIKRQVHTFGLNDSSDQSYDFSDVTVFAIFFPHNFSSCLLLQFHKNGIRPYPNIYNIKLRLKMLNFSEVAVKTSWWVVAGC